MTFDEVSFHERSRLRRMRLISLLEGGTLIVLVFIAVPLKHFGGYRMATTIMGPIHGVAFLLYIWTLVHTVAAGDWSRREIARMAVAALIPFGAFVNERMLKHKEMALAARP